MSRPHVQVPTVNLAPHLRRHLQGQLAALCALPGLVGLMLNGGLSRGYADRLSEIDVTIFLEPAMYAVWQEGVAPLTLGICVREGQLYDLKAADYAAEAERTWSPLECWDASYAEVLHDPTGRIAALVAAKLAHKPDPGMAEGPLFRCWWCFRLACDIWVHRQDPLQGHVLAQKAVEALVEALFWANGEHPPHEKWLIHLSRSLAWTPPQWEARLAQALSTGDLSTGNLTAASLRARQAVIEQLWREVDAQVKRQCDPDLPVHVMQRSFYRALERLAAKGALSHAEWEAMLPLSLLNHDPFHPIVQVTDSHVLLLPDALEAVPPDAMYEWHYAVLQAVRRQG